MRRIILGIGLTFSLAFSQSYQIQVRSDIDGLKIGKVTDLSLNRIYLATWIIDGRQDGYRDIYTVPVLEYDFSNFELGDKKLCAYDNEHVGEVDLSQWKEDVAVVALSSLQHSETAWRLLLAETIEVLDTMSWPEGSHRPEGNLVLHENLRVNEARAWGKSEARSAYDPNRKIYAVIGEGHGLSFDEDSGEIAKIRYFPALVGMYSELRECWQYDLSYLRLDTKNAIQHLTNVPKYDLKRSGKKEKLYEYSLPIHLQ